MVESKQTDRIKKKGLEMKMKGEYSGLLVILSWQRKEGYKEAVIAFYLCVKEVLCCSSKASVLFRGDTGTSDNRFMILGIPFFYTLG